MTKSEAYQILGVPEDAPASVVKKAYRSLSKRYHPDNQNTGNDNLFRSIRDAYEAIKKGEFQSSSTNAENATSGRTHYRNVDPTEEAFHKTRDEFIKRQKEHYENTFRDSYGSDTANGWAAKAKQFKRCKWCSTKLRKILVFAGEFVFEILSFVLRLYLLFAAVFSSLHVFYALNLYEKGVELQTILWAELPLIILSLLGGFVVVLLHGALLTYLPFPYIRLAEKPMYLKTKQWMFRRFWRTRFANNSGY